MSLSLTCLGFFLLPLPILCNTTVIECPHFIKPRVFCEGDLLLDGFIPLYKVNLPPKSQQFSFVNKPSQHSFYRWIWSNYQYFMAFYFAIEEINQSTDLLPNLTLGFNIYNVVDGDHRTLENLLVLLSGGEKSVPNYNCQQQGKSVAVIVGTKEEFLTKVGTVLELYKIPQVTYAPFYHILSDKDLFPSVYQMAAKDNFLVRGVVCLLLHFDWTWVGFFGSEDLKCKQFLLELKAQIVKKDICVVFAIMVSNILTEETFGPMATVCQDISTVNVSIVYGNVNTFFGIVYSEKACKVSGHLWILTADSHIDLYQLKNLLPLFYGCLLSFSPQKREVPGFEHFKAINSSKDTEHAYSILLLLDIFDCSFDGSFYGRQKNCPPKLSSELILKYAYQTTMSESNYIIYKAVHAVGRALHEMFLAKTETELTDDVNEPVFFSWQLHPFLRNIHFINSIGDHVTLNDKVISKTQYDVLNIVPFPSNHDFVVKVGEFVSNDTNQKFIIQEETIAWPLNSEKPLQSVCSQRCAPGFKKIINETDSCCFKCVFCPNGEISDKKEYCTQCSHHEYSNEERTYCLPRLVTYLAFEDSTGMTLTCAALCFSVLTIVILCIFVKNQDTPIVKANNRTLSYILLISLLLCFLCSLLFIGRPNTVTCILQQVTFAVVFTVAVSTTLAKTITVILAFKALKPGRTMRWLLVSGASNYVIPVCTVIQVVICGLWLGLSPPFVDIDTHSEPRHLLILCNKGSVTAFYCVLGYLGSLALVSFSLSYLVRNLPDTFNEAKFLTFSMLVFCTIWLTFLPVYHSAQGKVMVALEIFSILASTAVLLLCIFAPKCYIILTRPNKVSLKNLQTKMGPAINTCS